MLKSTFGRFLRENCGKSAVFDVKLHTKEAVFLSFRLLGRETRLFAFSKRGKKLDFLQKKNLLRSKERKKCRQIKNFT